MSIIKNKSELVKRAEGHAVADHIHQGTYGEGETNGTYWFKGCAIGCLATPHRENALREWLAKFYNDKSWGLGRDSAQDMIDRLGREFGISEYLARLAEWVFEGLEYHGAAINFVPEFAKALPEGREVTDDECSEWLDNATAEDWNRDSEGMIEGYPVVSFEDARESLLEWLGAKA